MVETSTDGLEGLRGTWVERATERLRQSGEVSASLRSSINSAREHLAAYQASDYATDDANIIQEKHLCCICPVSPSPQQARSPSSQPPRPTLPVSMLSIETSRPLSCTLNNPSPAGGAGGFRAGQRPRGRFNELSPGSTSVASASHHSPIQPGRSKASLAPCSPSTEQLISQSALLHQTMQEQAAQLRAQQDKLTALSRRVLKHAGQGAPLPNSSSHLSPPPLHHTMPAPAMQHASSEAVHALRSSSSSSHGAFTVRRSSRSALASAQTDVAGGAPPEDPSSRAPNRASVGMATVPESANLGHEYHEHKQDMYPQNTDRVPLPMGPRSSTGGQHSTYEHVQPRHEMYDFDNNTAGGEPADPTPAFRVRHTSSTPNAGDVNPGLRPALDPAARDMRSSQSHASRCAHVSAPPYPHCAADGTAPHSTWVHPPPTDFSRAAPRMDGGAPVMGYGAYPHRSHAFGNQNPQADAPDMPPPGAVPCMPYMHQAGQGSRWPAGEGHGMHSHPLSQAPQTDVQSAVSELLQTLSETRQRHSAAVQRMQASTQQSVRDTSHPAGAHLGTAPSLTTESSGLRAVQHPVVQSVINQLVSSIAQTNSNTHDAANAAERGVHEQPIPVVATEERFPDVGHGLTDDSRPQSARHAATSESEYIRSVQRDRGGRPSATLHVPETLSPRTRDGRKRGTGGVPAAEVHGTSGNRSFLSVRDLRPAESSGWGDQLDSHGPVHPLHAWENGVAGRGEQQQRSAAAGDMKGGAKRVPGQRRKAGWDGNVGVPWSEADRRGKGSRKIPPIGGWGNGHGDDPSTAAASDPLKLFKASTRGVGVPLRREAHVHDAQEPSLGKRGRERGMPGVADVPNKARAARQNRPQGQSVRAAQKKEFTVHRAGGLRKGKGGWSLKKQPNVGDFAGDPILEGESTVLSAGEEESGCESERDSDFGDEQGGYAERGLSDEEGVVWGERDAVRAAAHALHARGSAPTPDDAVNILEAQLREAVQAAEEEAQESENSQRSGDAGGSLRSEARLPHSSATHTATTSPSDTNVSPSEAPSLSTEPPPAAWNRLEELEARVDALVSKMHAPHAQKPPRQAREAHRETSPMPQDVHRGRQQHHDWQQRPVNGGMDRSASPQRARRSAHEPTPPCRNQNSDLHDLAEKLSDIELAEKAIFDRWFTPDGVPRCTPLAMPLSNSTQRTGNVQTHAPQPAVLEERTAGSRPDWESPGLNVHKADQRLGQESQRAVKQNTNHGMRAESQHVLNAQNPSMLGGGDPDGQQACNTNCARMPTGALRFPTSARACDARDSCMPSTLQGGPDAVPMLAGEAEGLAVTDTVASGVTDVSVNATAGWAMPGGETSRNILRRTPLCMHGPRDVCAHCIGNTPPRPDGDKGVVDMEGAQEGRSDRQSPPVHTASDLSHVRESITCTVGGVAEVSRPTGTAALFSMSEVEEIIAARDANVAQRAEAEAKHLAAGGCESQGALRQSQGGSATVEPGMLGMHRTMYVAAVETLADSVVDAVLEEHVDVMLSAVDSAAARMVAEECAGQFADETT